MFKNKKIFSFFLLVVSLLALGAAKVVLAGDPLGIEPVDESLVLGARDPRQIAVQIINIFLGILGVIAVSLVIYGGFLWMTSEGNEDQVSKAKNVLKNALIGLAIILASWGIVTFIFRSLLPITSPGPTQPPSSSAFFQTGLGAIGSCSLESVYPNPGQKAVSRNTMIMATFKEEIATNSISTSTVVICDKNDFNYNSLNSPCPNPVSYSFSTSDEKTIVFVPNSYLGNENGFSNYVVYFSNGLLKKDESGSIFSTCSPQYFVWEFEVSNLLDLEPPTIKSIFPAPDNSQDQISISSTLAFAQGSLNVVGQPNYYQAAKIISVSPSGADAEINDNYNGSYTTFNVVIDASETKVQLSSGGTNLGAFDIINDEVVFTNYFKLIFTNNISAGSSFVVTASKMIPADTITVGSYIYTFVDGPSSGYNISTSGNVASNIRLALGVHPNVEVLSGTGSLIGLKAKVGGAAGNTINLQSSNNSAITAAPFTGGSNQVENVAVNGLPDKPMNSVIQINFSEAVNPLMVSGASNEVDDTIRILNSNSGALSDGATCTINSNCKSYNCSTGVCVGDYLEGKFEISTNYQTVEFKSNVKCGVNGCGEDIYCLPANSNLKVEMVAANLFNCAGDNANCANKSPHTNCDNNTCTDPGTTKKYPLSNLSLGVGVMDAAGNSFDGNSDGYSDGPASYYYKNTPVAGSGDNFSWSFWISNKIESDPPIVENVVPSYSETAVDLMLPLQASFNKLMMGSGLRTGSVDIDNGNEIVNHRLINLLGGQLVGYWIGSNNIDSPPMNGEPDKTNVLINHARFFEGADYKAQIGSGVKDIYQNCFKPSVGPGCTVSHQLPFCCNGTSSATYCGN